MAMELGNIAKKHKSTTQGTNVVIFFVHDAIKSTPTGRKITSANILGDYRPQKLNPNSRKITVG